MKSGTAKPKRSQRVSKSSQGPCSVILLLCLLHQLWTSLNFNKWNCFMKSHFKREISKKTAFWNWSKRTIYTAKLTYYESCHEKAQAIATHRKRNADAITPIIKKACSNWLVKNRCVVWHKRHMPTAPLWRWQSQFSSFAVLASDASQRLDTEVQRVAEEGGKKTMSAWMMSPVTHMEAWPKATQTTLSHFVQQLEPGVWQSEKRETALSHIRYSAWVIEPHL